MEAQVQKTLHVFLYGNASTNPNFTSFRTVLNKPTLPARQARRRMENRWKRGRSPVSAALRWLAQTAPILYTYLHLYVRINVYTYVHTHI